MDVTTTAVPREAAPPTVRPGLDASYVAVLVLVAAIVLALAIGGAVNIWTGRPEGER